MSSVISKDIPLQILTGLGAWGSGWDRQQTSSLPKILRWVSEVSSARTLGAIAKNKLGMIAKTEKCFIIRDVVSLGEQIRGGEIQGLYRYPIRLAHVCNFCIHRQDISPMGRKPIAYKQLSCWNRCSSWQWCQSTILIGIDSNLEHEFLTCYR